MTLIFNREEVKKKRRWLRNNMPAAEAALWLKLKQKQLFCFRFRRQYSVGPYIVDFYCPAARLVIEIDGDSHFNDRAQQYDKQREAYLQQFDLKIIRFTNQDVIHNIEGVLLGIAELLQNPSLPPLRKGRNKLAL